MIINTINLERCLMDGLSDDEFTELLHTSTDYMEKPIELYVGKCIPKGVDCDTKILSNYLNRNFTSYTLAYTDKISAIKSARDLNKKDGYSYVTFKIKCFYYYKIPQSNYHLAIIPKFTDIIRVEDFNYKRQLVRDNDIDLIIEEAFIDYEFLNYLDNRVGSNVMNKLYNKWKDVKDFPNKLQYNIKEIMTLIKKERGEYYGN